MGLADKLRRITKEKEEELSKIPPRNYIKEKFDSIMNKCLSNAQVGWNEYQSEYFEDLSISETETLKKMFEAEGFSVEVLSSEVTYGEKFGYYSDWMEGRSAEAARKHEDLIFCTKYAFKLNW